MSDDTVRNESEESLYSILRCEDTATYEDLKRSYLQLIKEYHPDKQVVQSHHDFAKIDMAWKVLREEQTRKEYDASRLQSRLNRQSLVYANLDKNQLTFDADSLAFYPCRCGSEFVIHEDYLIEDECEIECSECSNCIVIK